jgi:hypothetical protein
MKGLMCKILLTMKEEINKDRSPNYPKHSLQDAIALASKLHGKAGKSKLTLIAAVGALGYSGISGASLTAIGTLTSYGLIERDRGVGITISPLAIKLLHPTDKIQEGFARVEAALFPKVFNELYSDGHRDGNEEILKNHLVQKGFTPDGAAKAAKVYVENFVFANLSNDGRLQEKVAAKEQQLSDLYGKPPETKKNNVTAYSVPLGSTEATITFSGGELSAQDFDALADYIQLFKKQFERRIKEPPADNAEQSN